MLSIASVTSRSAFLGLLGWRVRAPSSRSSTRCSSLSLGVAKLGLVGLLAILHFVEGGHHVADLIAARPVHRRAFAALTRSVDRGEQPLQRDADGPAVGDQRRGPPLTSRRKPAKPPANSRRAAGIGADLCVGQRDRQMPDDLRLFVVLIDDVFLGIKLLFFDSINLADEADREIKLVINHRGRDVRVSIASAARISLICSSATFHKDSATTELWIATS